MKETNDMRNIQTNALIALTVTASLTLVACSKGSNPGSPLAPSASSAGSSSPAPSANPAPAAVSGGATIAGVVVSGTSSGATLQAASVGRVLVTVLGTSVSTTTDDNGNFTLQNVPAGTQTLSINGNGIAAQVSLSGVSSNEQIRVTVRVDGGGAGLDDRQRETSDNQVEVEGVITSVSGSTLLVGRLNTPVMVASTTAITRAGAAARLSELIAGVRVEVHGTKSGATVTADRVNIEDSVSPGGTTPTTDDRNSSVGEIELSGALSARPTGTCPTITFVLAASTVITNSSTQFDDAVCASLAAGDTVKVEGTKQSNGQVLAREVKRTSTASGSTSGSSGGSGTSSGSSGSNGSGSDDKGGDDKGGSSNSGGSGKNK